MENNTSTRVGGGAANYLEPLSGRTVSLRSQRYVVVIGSPQRPLGAFLFCHRPSPEEMLQLFDRVCRMHEARNQRMLVCHMNTASAA